MDTAYNKPNPANNETGKLDPETIKNYLDEATIRPDEETAEPPVCLSIKQGLKDVPIGALGEFSLIIGKAKSRKTFFVSIALAAAARNGLIMNRFKGLFPTEKNVVLFFDTEQGRHYVNKVYRRVSKMANIPGKGNFKAISLRKYDTDLRLAMIEQAIYKTPGLGLVVIDGIRDLVKSINDEAEATEIATKLLKWTEELSIHIIVVLHQNKSDSNARGHIGTELINKAQTTLSVKKDENNKDLSIVEAEFCKDIEPDPFAFYIVDGIPEIDDSWTGEKKSNKQANLPDDTPAAEHKEKLKAIAFKNSAGMTRDELLSRIRNSYRIGESKARTFLEHFIDAQWIQKEGKNHSRSVRYFIDVD